MSRTEIGLVVLAVLVAVSAFYQGLKTARWIGRDSPGARQARERDSSR
jgi:hypothetical protein